MVKWLVLLLLSLHSVTHANTDVLLLQQDRAAIASSQAIRITATVSSLSAWEREQIIVKVEATTPDLYSSLQLESLKIKGLDIYPIASSTDRFEQNRKKQAQLSAGWIMYAIADGQYEIKLPDIQYELNGVIRHTIAIPAFTLDVKALPVYIPPTLPVGKISLEQSFSSNNIWSDNLVNTHTLAYWDLVLTGEGLPAHWLPAVLRQIQSNNDIRYSPVTSERHNKPAVQGMKSQVTHTIPLKALTNGKLDLPVLRVQYFDPADGRLKTIVMEKHSIFVLSSTWRILLVIVLAGLLYKAGTELKIYARRKWLKRKRINEAIQQIAQAKSAHEIRTALNKIALAENWPANLSISAWYHCWQSKYRHQDNLDGLLHRLSLACYSNKQITLDNTFRNDLIAHLKTPAMA